MANQKGGTRLQEVRHYPRLDTVLMVERTIQTKKEFPSKRQLWQALPRQVQYQTFNTIFNYLENSGKILHCKDGAVIWIYDPETIQKLLDKDLILR